MKKIKLPASVKDIEKNYKNLSFEDFFEYVFSLEMDFWQYAELKNQFIVLYGELCSTNIAYLHIYALYEEKRRSELNNLIKRIESDVKLYPTNIEKIEFLNKELNNLKSEWMKLVPEIYHSINLLNTFSPLGLGSNNDEIIYLYKDTSDYLIKYINKLEEEDLIERTPIINNLRASLGNFTFNEWTIKAEREAPKNLNERLTYLISIRSDIQRWEDDNQKKKKNFFDIRRYTSDDERGNADGPTSNLLCFIGWCNDEIEAIQRQRIHKISNSSKKVIPFKSFEYIHMPQKPSNISDLFNGLIKSKIIHENTKLTDFRKVFSGVEIFNPIIWTGDEQDLPYFIKLIYCKYKLLVKIPNRGYWDITIKCFLKKDGSPFIKEKLSGAKKPTYPEKIIKAAKLLLTLICSVSFYN